MFGLATMDEMSRPCSIAMDSPHSFADDFPVTMAQQKCPVTLPDLPSELIDHILSYLSPVDLAAICAVNRTLFEHAMEDHLWQDIVQSNVPGVQIASPTPCASFRDLYIAHDPHWFLTKYKIWFCDRDLVGKLIVVRYNDRRGVIEGFQLLANEAADNSTNANLMNVNVDIAQFDPEIKLHLDKPVLQMRADSLENTIRDTNRKASLPCITPWSSSNASADMASTPAIPSTPSHPYKFATETPMPLDDRFSDSFHNTFVLARALPEESVANCDRLPFPYDNIWPPPAIPAAERVSSAHLVHTGGKLVAQAERPSRRSEISQKSFRIRSWMEMRPGNLRGMPHGLFGGDADWAEDPIEDVLNQASRAWMPNFMQATRPSTAAHVGDSLTTFSTLEPDLYTPTPDQPWKGIWVGDYSTHGCEFLLIKQSHPTPFDEVAFNATRTVDETDSEFEQRKSDARRYRGSLEAVKLTGDPNVPRGEVTFVAEDLGEDGYVATIDEQPFQGTRVVQSKGHIARPGFTNDRYIRSQLLLISENRIAQHWVGWNHISYFQRVDIDKFLVPN